MRVLIHWTQHLISEPNCCLLKGIKWNTPPSMGLLLSKTNTLWAQKHLLTLTCSLTKDLMQHNKHNCSLYSFSNAWVQSLIELRGNTLTTHREAARPSLFTHGHRDCIRSQRVQPAHHSINTRIKHTQKQCPSNESDDEDVRAPLLMLLVWRELESVSPVFFPPRSQTLMFLQASCQIQFMAAQSEQERGDTGHCNEHLWDVSHQSMRGSEIENSKRDSNKRLWPHPLVVKSSRIFHFPYSSVFLGTENKGQVSLNGIQHGWLVIDKKPDDLPYNFFPRSSLWSIFGALQCTGGHC